VNTWWNNVDEDPPKKVTEKRSGLPTASKGLVNTWWNDVNDNPQKKIQDVNQVVDNGRQKTAPGLMSSAS
jgi:hypothetical protein